MGDSFEAQKRYFQVQIDNFKEKPELHKNMNKDCIHYLKALDETGSPAAFRDYVQKTGNMLSTGKANVRDRYENRKHLYQKLGQEKKVKADELRLQVIEKAQSHQELSRELEDIENKTHPIEMAENKAIGTIMHLMKAFFHLATDPPGSEAQKRSITIINTYWKQLKEADPEITWEKMTAYPPYRDRIIFTDQQLAQLKKVFQEAKNGRNS